MDLIRKLSPYRNKIIAVVLCLAIIITGIQYTAEKKEIYGNVTNNMQIEFVAGNNFNILGEGNLQTTFGQDGGSGCTTILKVLYSGEPDPESTPRPEGAADPPDAASYTKSVTDNGKATLRDVSLSTSWKKSTDSETIIVTYTVKNNSAAPRIVSIGTHADIKVGDGEGSDSATVKNIAGNRGFTMSANEKMFTVMLRDTYGVDNVDTYWYGRYNQRTNNLWFDSSRNDLVNTDSGMAFSWKDRKLTAGETQTFSFAVGVGEVNNPPELQNVKFCGHQGSFEITENANLNFTGEIRDKDGDPVTIKYQIFSGDGRTEKSGIKSLNSTPINCNSFTDFDLSQRYTRALFPNAQEAVINDIKQDETSYKLKIWAQDSKGAQSSTITVNFIYVLNWLKINQVLKDPNNSKVATGVKLVWPAGQKKDTVYKLYRWINRDNFQQILSHDYENFQGNIQVLLVHPEPVPYEQHPNPNAAAMVEWMNNANQHLPAGFPKIEVETVPLSTFRSDPKGWLADYKVTVFGFWDGNNGEDILNPGEVTNDPNRIPVAVQAIRDYIAKGNSVIFGHDTVGLQSGFNMLADELNIRTKYRTYINGSLETTGEMQYYEVAADSTNLKINTRSIFSTVPFNVWDPSKLNNWYKFDNIFTIRNTNRYLKGVPLTHTTYQLANDENEIFLEFVENNDTLADFDLDVNGEKFKPYYLLVHNNVAQIQTGHFSGQGSKTEQAILANLIYYMYPESSVQVYDRDVGDDQPPNKPSEIKYDEDSSTDTIIKYKVSATDNATNIQYYIEMFDKKNQEEWLNQSEIAEADLKSEVARIEYKITESEDAPATDSGFWTSKSATEGQAVALDVNQIYNDGNHWIHVRAVDNAGNIGPVRSKKIDEAHKVSYDYETNGGKSTTASERKVNVGRNVDLSFTAVKEGDTGTYNSTNNPDGWQFVGWNTDKNATNGLSSLKMGTSDITLYAIYKKNVTLTQKYWDDNEYAQKAKTTDVSVYNKNTNATFTTSTIPDLSGWNTRGWSKTKCGASVTWREKVSDANQHVYPVCACGATYTYTEPGWIYFGTCAAGHSHAIWAPHTITAHCPSCNSNFTYTVPEGRYYTCDKDSELPDAEVGYKCAGNDNRTVTIPEDRTIYALYSKDVKATFTGYDSSGVKKDSEITKTKYTNAYSIFNEKIPTISLLPTSGTTANDFDGWKCRGWSTSTSPRVDSYNIKAGGSSHNLSYDITFYAQYEKELKGTFIDYNGKNKRTREDKQKAYVNSFKIDDKAWPTITFPAQGNYMGDPESGSWVTSGYSTEGDTSNTAGTAFTQNATTTIKEDSTYYGLYRRYITLSYNSHGGDSTPSMQTYYQSVNSADINKLSNKKINIGAAPSKTGFTFVGWRENSETGTKYDPNAVYTLTHVTTMHAAWIRNSYKVTYNYAENGGDSTTAGNNVYTLYQNNIDLSFTATKAGDTGAYSSSNPDGWQFVGWNTDKDATTGLASLVMGTEPVTLYAIYKKDITVTKEDINGTDRQTQKTVYTVYNKTASKNVDFGSALSGAGPSYDRTHGSWKFRGWTYNLCDAAVTWNTGSDYNQHVYRKCGCGTDYTYTDPSWIATGRCTKGHSRIIWAPHTITAHCPSCNSDFTYTVPDTMYSTCIKQGFEFTNDATDVPSCIASANVSSDITLYATYERDVNNVFVSYDGTIRKSESVKVPQQMVTDPGNSEFPYVQTVSVTMPTPYIYTKDGTWTSTGWSATSSGEKFDAGRTVTLKTGINMYANYTKDLNATFVDVKNGTKTSTTTSHAVTCHASDISALTYPSVAMKTANEYGNGYSIYGWTTGEKKLNPEYSVTSSTYLKEDTTFYAIYLGGILARYHYYETSGTPLCRENDATQKVNSSNPDTTMQTVTVSLGGPETGYTDDSGKMWNFLYWSTETGNNGISAGTDYTDIKQTTDFYAVYETTYTTIFQSDGKNERKTSKAKVNAHAIDAPDFGTVTTPILKTTTMQDAEWKPLGWTEGTSYDSDVDVVSGTTLTANRDVTYYGLYGNSSKVRFVDYNGSTKRERDEALVRKYNAAGNASPSTMKAPLQGARDGWQAAGWTTEMHLRPEKLNLEDTEFTPEPGATYYGFYKKDVALKLTTYRTTSSVPVTETKNANVFANSYDIESIRSAEFILPSIQGYTVNEKTYPGKCWTYDDNMSRTEEVGKTLLLTNDAQLYAVYKNTIRVTYDGNGGTTYATPDTQDKLLIASGRTYSSPLAITSSVPVRNGYQFLNKWGASKKETGDGYAPGSAQEFDSDITLYAQWGIRTIDKTVNINWVDRSNALDSRPENVYLTLYRDGEKVTKYLVSPLDDTVVSPVGNKFIDTAGVRIAVEKTGNSNTYTFSGLQQFNPASGDAYKYTIQEELFESNNSQTAYDIAVNQSTGVITNTLRDAGNKMVKAKFQWVDDLNKWRLRPTTMELKLYRKDPDTNEERLTGKHTVTFPDAEEKFEYLFNGQESINANGNAYEYKIVIPNVPNYAVTSTVTTGTDGSTTCNFVCKLEDVPGSFTGGNLNHVVLSADPYSSNNHVLPADKDDYLAIGATENRVFMLTLKPLKKTVNMTTGEEIYHSTYLTQTIDTRTKLPVKGKGINPPMQYARVKEVEYNVTVTPRYDVILEGLPDGKYELCPHDDSLFDFDKFAAAADEIVEARLTQENGKWYLTFSSHDEYSQVNKLHMNMIARPWIGYTNNGDEYKHIYDREDIGYPKYE